MGSSRAMRFLMVVAIATQAVQDGALAGVSPPWLTGASTNSEQPVFGTPEFLSKMRGIRTTPTFHRTLIAGGTRGKLFRPGDGQGETAKLLLASNLATYRQGPHQTILLADQDTGLKVIDVSRSSSNWGMVRTIVRHGIQSNATGFRVSVKGDWPALKNSAQLEPAVQESGLFALGSGVALFKDEAGALQGAFNGASFPKGQRQTVSVNGGNVQYQNVIRTIDVRSGNLTTVLEFDKWEMPPECLEQCPGAETNKGMCHVKNETTGYPTCQQACPCRCACETRMKIGDQDRGWTDGEGGDYGYDWGRVPATYITGGNPGGGDPWRRAFDMGYTGVNFGLFYDGRTPMLAVGMSTGPHTKFYSGGFPLGRSILVVDLTQKNVTCCRTKAEYDKILLPYGWTLEPANGPLKYCHVTGMATMTTNQSFNPKATFPARALVICHGVELWAVELTGQHRGRPHPYPFNDLTLKYSVPTVKTLEQQSEVRVQGRKVQFLFALVAVRPDDAVAYLWGVHGWLLSLQLVGPETGVYQVVHPTRLTGLMGMVMLSTTMLAYADGLSVMQVDLTPTIVCNDYPFLAASLQSYPVSQPGRVDVYRKYIDGRFLPNTGRVWSFVGYKKMSPKKEYGDNSGFHFSKSLLCFQPCKKNLAFNDSECTHQARYGKDKCCVIKAVYMKHEAIPLMNEEDRLWAKQKGGIVHVDNLTRADGVKVF